LKINVYFIFLNIGDLTFGITLVLLHHILHLYKFVTVTNIFNWEEAVIDEGESVNRSQMEVKQL
jgi:hypothetical protein